MERPSFRAPPPLENTHLQISFAGCQRNTQGRRRRRRSYRQRTPHASKAGAPFNGNLQTAQGTRIDPCSRPCQHTGKPAAGQQLLATPGSILARTNDNQPFQIHPSQGPGRGIRLPRRRHQRQPATGQR